MKTPVNTFLALLLICTPLVMFVRCPPAPEQLTTDWPVDEPLAAGFPEIVTLRTLAKDRIAEDVVAGRRTLLEAAALFRELNRLPPEPLKPSWIDPSLRIPADTEEGWLCRQVIERVRLELRREPDRAAAAVARLEAEFHE